MQAKRIVPLLFSVVFLLQCGMFEDIALFSGKDLGDIKVDVYYDDGGAPKTLYRSVDRGYSFNPVIVTYPAGFGYWAVNKNNDLLTTEADGSNNSHVFLWNGGVNPVEKGYFGNPDSVGPITAGPKGEFYLCASVSEAKWLYILPPGAPAIQPVFSNINIITNNIVNIWAVKFRGTTVLYVSDAANSLYHSLNGGQSFEAITTPFSSPITDIVCFHDEVYVATNAATPSIYKSSDSVNFAQISSSPESCASLLVQQNRIYAATSSGGLYFSFDGNNWLMSVAINLNGVESDYTGRLYLAPSIESAIYVSDDFGMSVFMIAYLTTYAHNLSVVSYK